MLVLKLPPFFPCRVGEGKRAANFSQKRVRSYIVLTLGSATYSLVFLLPILFFNVPSIKILEDSAYIRLKMFQGEKMQDFPTLITPD